MKQEAKEKTYQDMYQIFKEDKDIKNLNYPQERTNYDFSCEIGCAKIKFSLNATQDFFVIKSESEHPEMASDELFNWGEGLVNDTNIRFSSHDHKLTLIHSLPMPDMPDDAAIDKIKEITEDFIKVIKKNFLGKEVKKTFVEETSSMNVFDEMFNSYVEEERPVNYKEKEVREKPVKNERKDKSRVNFEKTVKVENKVVKIVKENENAPSMPELYDKYKTVPEVRVKMQQMYADMDRVYLCQTKQIDYAKENLKRRESILAYNQASFEKEKELHAKEYSELEKRIKSFNEECNQLKEERKQIERIEKQIVLEREALSEMQKSIDERIRIVEHMEAEKMPGMNEAIFVNYEEQILELKKSLDYEIEYSNKKEQTISDLERQIKKLREKISNYEDEIVQKEEELCLKNKQCIDLQNELDAKVSEGEAKENVLEEKIVDSNKASDKKDINKIFEDVHFICEQIGEGSKIERSVGIDGIIFAGVLNHLNVMINPGKEVIRIEKNVKRVNKKLEEVILKHNRECVREMFYFDDKKTIVCRGIISNDIKNDIMRILDIFTEM